jgi:hypothetical protein
LGIGRFCASNLTWFSTAEHAKEFSVQLGYSFAVNRALVHDHAVWKWLQLLPSMSVCDSFTLLTMFEVVLSQFELAYLSM